MKKLKILNHPQFIERSEYNKLKDKIVSRFKNLPNIESIYQMGSVREPGISDLDVICVFKDESNCNINMRSEISDEEKKILTHSLFGIEKRYFKQALNYNLASNLNLLHGEDLETLTIANKNIERQVALEYMLRMYLSLSEQIFYGLVKLRSFLLLGKAIKFDLDLLNVTEGELFDLVNKILSFRSIWFTDIPSQKVLEDLIFSFQNELDLFLQKELKKGSFFLPTEKICFPEGYCVEKSTRFEYFRKGFVLPSFFKLIGKKYINLQRRFGSVNYLIPFSIPAKNSDIDQRFHFGKKLYEINKENYPYFLPLNSSLSIF